MTKINSQDDVLRVIRDETNRQKLTGKQLHQIASRSTSISYSTICKLLNFDTQFPRYRTIETVLHALGMGFEVRVVRRTEVSRLPIPRPPRELTLVQTG